MTSTHSSRWFWSDWAGDEAVRRLSPAERGMWIDLLTLAASGNPTGYVCDARGAPVPVEEIARFANCSAGEAASLIDGILAKGVASRDRTGRLFNRRMVRDLELSVKRRRAGSAGAAATALKWQALNGLPQQLPGHVPRQTGTRALPEETTKTFSGAARARAAPVDNAGTASADRPAGLRERAAEAVRQSTDVASDALHAAMQAKGWVR